LATPVILTNCKAYLEGYDVSGDMNQLALAYGAEIKDASTFGKTTRVKKGALKEVSASMAGFWESDTDKIDPVLFDRIGLNDKLITLCPETGAQGEIAYSFRSVLGEYAPGAQHGELLVFKLSAQGSDLLLRGKVMENAAKTSTANGTAGQLGAVTADQKVYAVMHVLAVSGTNPTLDMVVQSDNAEAFLSPTARLTFTQATARGAEWKEAAGAIADDWWRCSWTIGGTDTPSFTVAVIVGIL
jgi:hypothetical protein